MLFTFSEKWLPDVLTMSDAELSGFIRSLVFYAAYGRKPENPSDLFALAAAEIDARKEHEAAVSAARSEAGKKSAAAKQKQRPSPQRMTPEPSAEAPKKSSRFVPPTVQEVFDYCAERKNDIDAEEFVDFYTRNGWKVGKAGTPMKDWKAAVRTWEHDRKKRGGSANYANGAAAKPYQQKTYVNPFDILYQQELAKEAAANGTFGNDADIGNDRYSIS